MSNSVPCNCAVRWVILNLIRFLLFNRTRLLEVFWVVGAGGDGGGGSINLT